MKIKFNVFNFRRVQTQGGKNSPIHSTATFDLCEEYANAFRTESYNEFWTRVLAFTYGDSATCPPIESTTAARLSSYRLFTEHLLEPDQPTVTKTLALSQLENRPENHSLLSDYFSNTADASQLCGLLLKDIDQARRQYRPLKTNLDSLKTTKQPLENHFLKNLDFSNNSNPFCSSGPTQTRFRSVQTGCQKLLDRLESSREKARARLRFVNRFKHGSALVLIAIAASVIVIATTHALALLVATPGFVVAWTKKVSSRRLARASAQLDAAVRGTYILNRDLDTINRLLNRLHNEVEHIREMVRFWANREEGGLQPVRELARELEKNELSFREQLDELEEHLYLCYMTINRARSLVMKEVLKFGRI